MCVCCQTCWWLHKLVYFILAYKYQFAKYKKETTDRLIEMTMKHKKCEPIYVLCIIVGSYKSYVDKQPISLL